MLVRRKCLLIGLAVAILVTCIAFSSCIFRLSPPEGLPEGYDLGDDYLLFQVSEVGQETFRISKSGDVEYVIFSSPVIYRYDSGKLSEEDMKELSEFLENSRFFDLKDVYYPYFEINEPYHTYDYFTISVYREGEIKTVYDYGSAAAPDSFYDVLSYLRKKVEPKLQNNPRYGIFIMAERTKSKIDESILIDEDIGEYSLITQAISNPGWFIYVGSLDDTELDDYISSVKDDFYAIFKGEQFYIGVYERTE
jgi:hypothetical protein